MVLLLFLFENRLDDVSISARHQGISIGDEELIVTTVAATAITNETALMMDTVLCSMDDDKDTRGTQEIRRGRGRGNPVPGQKADCVCQKETAAMLFNSV